MVWLFWINATLLLRFFVARRCRFYKRHIVRFPVNSRLPKGSILDIKIEDPNSSRLLSLRGKVNWLEEFSGEDDSASARYETGVSLLKKNLF